MRNLLLALLAFVSWLAHAAVLGVAPTTGAGPVTFIPSRTSGVAPLFVFFDTVGQVPASVSREPFLDLEYKWDFGDVTAGTWAFGSMAGIASKNAAVGPVAGHIFETPGTYSVCLTVKDRVGAVLTPTCQNITVTDPDVVFASTTVCVNAVSSDFSQCPSANPADHVINSDFDAVITAQTNAGKRRVLFNRGETFNVSVPASPTVTGPGLIGAYGTGVRPKVLNGVVNTVMLTFNTSGIADWRVMDLELDGNSAPGSQGVQPNRYILQLTLLRLEIHHTNVGVATAISTLDIFNAAVPCTGGFPYNGGGCVSPVWDQLALQDSELHTMGTGTVNGGGNGLYWSAIRSAVLGNRIEDTNNGQGEHNVRIAFADRLAFNHNYLAYPKTNKSVLTTRGPIWSGTAGLPAETYSQYIVHGYNKLVGGTPLNSMIVVLPVAANNDHRLRYLIYEGNLLVAGAGTQSMMSLDAASYVAVRNNVFNNDLGVANPFSVGSGDAVPPAVAYVYVYNNTFMKTTVSPTCTGIGSDRCGGWTPMRLARRSNNLHLRNNLAYAPLVTSTPPGDAATNIVTVLNINTNTNTASTTSNNTSNSQMLNTNPNFINASGTFGLLSDYKPACTGTTYPCGQGTHVPVWSDALGVPATSSRVLGAINP